MACDVLDAGCGTGRWLQLLASRRADEFDWRGLRPPRCCTVLQPNLDRRASLRPWSCTALPVRDAEVDFVVWLHSS